MSEIPETTKRKILKPRRWAGEEPTVVYLAPTPLIPTTAFSKRFSKRRLYVYAENGSRLGFIEEYHGSIDTKIRGTRLRRQGKRRTFWAANGTNYWRYHPSQADAIRELMEEST